MDEDNALADFADLLIDPTDIGNAVQEPGVLPEISDYGQLYAYGSFPDFAMWDGRLEGSNQSNDIVPPEPQPLPPLIPELDDEIKVEIDDVFIGKICAFCLERRVLIQCPKCKVAHYCSREHQAAHSSIHDPFCGNKGGAAAAAAAAPIKPPDLNPGDAQLHTELLELLSLFETVYEPKERTNSERTSLVQKCVTMCERIMDRYYRLPQVVAMHEQAKALLQMMQNGDHTGPSSTARQAENQTSSSGMSVLDHLKSDVQEALDRVDAEERETVKDDLGEGEEENGVYYRKGISYCKNHINLEHCEECGVDYRLLNKLHRENAEEVDETLRKEQERLEELEKLKHNKPVSPEIIKTEMGEEPLLPIQVPDSEEEEDFRCIAKDLKEELDRAREKEEADFLNSFASFQIS